MTTLSKLSVILISGVVCLACNSVSDKIDDSANRSVAVEEKQGTVPGKLWEGKIRQTQSVLIRRQTSSLDVAKISLNSQQDLQSVAFPSSDHAWLVGMTELFESDNGGERWTSAAFPISKSAAITATFFLNGITGWIAVDETTQNGIDTSHHLEIRRTDDSGHSWRRQYEADNTAVWSMRFLNKEEGWLAGTKYVNPSPFAPLVVRTLNGGDEWLDVSEGVRVTLDKNKKAPSARRDYGIDLIAVTSHTATLATGRMHMFHTQDDGRLWDEIVHLADVGAENGMRVSGILNNRYWLVGSTMGEEGVGSILARQQSDGNWISYRIPGAYFKHVYFIDDTNILACGSLPATDRSRRTESNIKGVILASPDGGTTWVTLYEEPNSHVLNFIGSDAGGRIWVVGNNGTILRLGSVTSILSALHPR